MGDDFMRGSPIESQRRLEGSNPLGEPSWVSLSSLLVSGRAFIQPPLWVALSFALRESSRELQGERVGRQATQRVQAGHEERERGRMTLTVSGYLESPMCCSLDTRVLDMEDYRRV